jgi:hypothetical protein
MIDHTERTFGPKPRRLIADTVYGTGRFLGWQVKEKAITPHIPVWDMSKRKDGTFTRSATVFLDWRGIAGPLLLSPCSTRGTAGSTAGPCH